ncbi:glycosyltransferase [Chitinophagaceae bacterium LWZ2-11]
MPTTQVSVIMCTYNGAAYIKQQIESILNQTYPLFEFIIFDDASIDNTFEILKEYERQYNFIRVLQNKKNIGVTKNFEQALRCVCGNVIAIADQDDLWRTDKIELMLKHWTQETPIIYCDSIRFTNKEPNNALPNINYRRFEGTNCRKISVFNTVSGHCIIMKRDFVNTVLPFKETVIFDWWIAIVAACNGGVSYFPETLVFQRMHQSNVTIGTGFEYTNSKENKYKYKQMVANHLKEFASAPNIPTEFTSFFESFFKLWKRGLERKFYLPLFLFIMKYRKEIFNYKAKKRSIFSYMKNIFYLVRN